MAKNDNLTDFLLDIAETLRKKLDISTPINPQDFKSKIELLYKHNSDVKYTLNRNRKYSYSVNGEIELTVDVPTDNSYVTLVDPTCYGGPENIKEVEIIRNSDVSTIKTDSFKYATNLTKLYIPSTITNFENNCLTGPKDLVLQVGCDIPDNFSYKTGIRENLKQIIFDGKIHYPETGYPVKDKTNFIGYSSFEYCTNLEAVYIPEGINLYSKDTDIAGNEDGGIKYRAFYGCTKLTYFNFYNSRCWKISNSAFYGCESLSGGLIAPPQLKKLEKNCFWLCKNLEYYDFTACNRVIECDEFPAGSVWVNYGPNSYEIIPWEISSSYLIGERERYNIYASVGKYDECPYETDSSGISWIIKPKANFKLRIPKKFENDYRNHEIWGHYFYNTNVVEVVDVVFDEDEEEESTTTTSTSSTKKP